MYIYMKKNEWTIKETEHTFFIRRAIKDFHGATAAVLWAHSLYNKQYTRERESRALSKALNIPRARITR